MTPIRENGRRSVFLTLPFAAASILLLGIAATTTWADDDDEVPFKEAHFFIEYNATAGDTGVQVFLDDDSWRKVTITDPDDRKLFVVKGKSTLGQQGLTELFFESVEPELADLPIVEFLERFPEGEYEFEGIRNDGSEIESEVEFTHVMPCGPEVYPEGMVLDPDAEIVISWGEVTEVVAPRRTDGTGETVCRPSRRLAIDLYQVIVEAPEGELIVDLSDEARTLTVPGELIEENAFYIYEVLAKEESGNQTITESFFCTGPDMTEVECAELGEEL